MADSVGNWDNLDKRMLEKINTTVVVEDGGNTFHMRDCSLMVGRTVHEYPVSSLVPKGWVPCRTCEALTRLLQFVSIDYDYESLIRGDS